jgi:hypothetical protein
VLPELSSKLGSFPQWFASLSVFPGYFYFKPGGMMKNPSPTPPGEPGKLSILIPAVIVLSYCDLKRKSDRDLESISREMAKYMASGKSGQWAIAKINFQMIKEILIQRKTRKVEQLSFVA